jgi:hypothetical protein
MKTFQVGFEVFTAVILKSTMFLDGVALLIEALCYKPECRGFMT